MCNFLNLLIYSNENNACTLEEISKVQAYFFTGKLDFGMMFLGIIDNLIVAWRKRVCYNVRKDFYEKNMTVCTEIFMNESLGR